MPNELREMPGGLLPPDAKIETRESRETQKTPEHPRPAGEAPAAEKRPAEPSFGPAPVAATAPTKDAIHMRVERILEENLGDVYFDLPADVRAKFKAKGEETAVTLRGMIESGRAAARKVLDLIRDWLKLIPGVNRYFLDQEAKIKTDKIMAIVEDRKREKEAQI